jgi:CxxC motif-containing protein (DUF1111 family)
MAEQKIWNGERKRGLLSRVGRMLGPGFLGCLVLMAGILVWAQTATDPGPRTGAAGAGSFQNGLTANEKAFEPAITGQFKQAFGVTGTPTCQPSGTPPCTLYSVSGLGPIFNSNSCASCHAWPNPGGSSPPPPPTSAGNPVFGFGNADNTVPTFERTNGPVLVPRFPYQISDLSVPDGLVHQLFTITGRSDNLPNCSLTQPNFNQASSEGDLVFRQPLPTFGDGYIEIVENTVILNNLSSNLAQKQAYGIGGAANIADDGSINRLGWKAQWRAILPAAGGEENVEMGVTNEMFPTETYETTTSNPIASCLKNPIPEDYTNYAYSGAGVQQPTYYPWNFPEGADRDAIFIRFLEQPTPGTCIADTDFGETAAQTCANGATQFQNVGCALCHTVSYTTPAGSIPSMGQIPANLYSDLLLHHMGNCLADNIVQGVAQGDMWRTPPLWNVGQRWWFMHDGRTNNIVTAIEGHSDSHPITPCTGNGSYPASEANQVITNFNHLSPKNQQDLINFLRSL